MEKFFQTNLLPITTQNVNYFKLLQLLLYFLFYCWSRKLVNTMNGRRNFISKLLILSNTDVSTNI
ncbi:hypothetical protein T01_14793 [Trichinella spiralis]|uniref:Uncharacterized protein n=1 Tax=Trichinella spiralis TaxID=6334 RepID=A0A0V1AYS6_TRISP|nr:hypothetical protein T01_14793 [Trichinella spiralis]